MTIQNKIKFIKRNIDSSLSEEKFDKTFLYNDEVINELYEQIIQDSLNLVFPKKSFYWNEETIQHFKMMSSYDSINNVKKSVSQIYKF